MQAAVGPQGARVRAAQFAASQGASYEEGLERAAALQRELPQVGVRTTDVGEETFPATLGRFDLGASSQLVMFVFIVSLTGSAALIQSRQLGVARRMAGPSSTSWPSWPSWRPWLRPSSPWPPGPCDGPRPPAPETGVVALVPSMLLRRATVLVAERKSIDIHHTDCAVVTRYL